MNIKFFDIECLWSDDYDFYTEKKPKREVIVPSGYTRLRGGEPRKRVTKVIIPEGYTEIYKGCFRDWERLSDIIFPDSIEIIGKDAFEGTKWLKNQKDDMVIVNKILLKYQGKDKNVVIPEGIKCIADNAFYASSISSIELPDSIEIIGENAFCYCTSLEMIKSNNLKIKTIGRRAFYGCCNLKDISFLTGNESFGLDCFTETGFLKNNNEDFVVVENTLLLYRGNERIPVIPEYINKIGSFAFYNSQIRGVVLPDALRCIGKEAFAECRKLESLIIPENVEYIESEAFGGCILLKEIVLPKLLKCIETGVFNFCLSLESIVIPKSVKKINDYAFSQCIHLSNITFQGIISEYGGSAFKGCVFLKNISIPGTEFSFGRNMFMGCVSLESVSFPDYDGSVVMKLPENMFQGCRKLKKFPNPVRLSEIKCGTFRECTELDKSFIIDDIEDEQVRKSKWLYIGREIEEEYY